MIYKSVTNSNAVLEQSKSIEMNEKSYMYKTQSQSLIVQCYTSDPH